MTDLTAKQAGVFETIKRLTAEGGEYWRARELQILLGYKTWENFEEAIKRAQESCDVAGFESIYEFRETTKMIEIGRGATRYARDYFLSRYACYLIAMNGDPSKSEIAAAQTYFAIQTRRQELSDTMSDDEKRLLVRERVRESNTQLNSTASRAGVKNFAFFHDAGYRGMYNMSQATAKKKKGIAPKEDFLDCVGRLELAANEFRITLTEERIRTQGTKGQSASETVHAAVGKKVRNTVVEEIGRPPEALERAEPLKRIRSKEQRKLKKK